MTQDDSAYRDIGLTLAARPDSAHGDSAHGDSAHGDSACGGSACGGDEVEPMSVTAAQPSASGASGLTGRDRTDALLAALTEMASLSLRRQADVAVAVRRAGLALGPDAVAVALDQLGRDGCIGPPLYLSDGGILVSVTVRGIEHLATTSHRHVAARLMSRGLV